MNEMFYESDKKLSPAENSKSAARAFRSAEALDKANYLADKEKKLRLIHESGQISDEKLLSELALIEAEKQVQREDGVVIEEIEDVDVSAESSESDDEKQQPRPEKSETNTLNNPAIEKASNLCAYNIEEVQQELESIKNNQVRSVNLKLHEDKILPREARYLTNEINEEYKKILDLKVSKLEKSLAAIQNILDSLGSAQIDEETAEGEIDKINKVLIDDFEFIRLMNSDFISRDYSHLSSEDFEQEVPGVGENTAEAKIEDEPNEAPAYSGNDKKQPEPDVPSNEKIDYLKSEEEIQKELAGTVPAEMTLAELEQVVESVMQSMKSNLIRQDKGYRLIHDYVIQRDKLRKLEKRKNKKAESIPNNEEEDDEPGSEESKSKDGLEDGEINGVSDSYTFEVQNDFPNHNIEKPLDYSLNYSQDINTDDKEQASVENGNDTAKENEGGTEKTERAEYLGLRRQFREAEKNYQKVLSEDFAKRGKTKKMFGLGRNTQTAEVHTAYDEMMKANKAYFQAGKNSGRYTKINERLNRTREQHINFVQDYANENNLDAVKFLELDSWAKVQQYATENKLNAFTLQKAVDKSFAISRTEEANVDVAVANRHVVRPAEKRLELQSRELPPRLRKMKEGLSNAIKNNPKTAVVIGIAILGTLAALNPAGIIVGGSAGLASKYFSEMAGDKFYVGRKVKNAEGVRTGATEAFDGSADVDLEKLEQEYFKSLEAVDTAEARNKRFSTIVGVGAGMTAGLNADSIINSVKDGFDTDSIIEGINNAKDGFDTDSIIESINNAKDRLGFGAPDNLPVGNEESFAETLSGDSSGAVETGVEPKPDLDPSPVSEETATSANSTEAAQAEAPVIPLAPEAVTNNVEAVFEPHVIEKGDTTSEVLVNAIREKLNSGEIKLPPGLSRDEIAHKMYQTFPEMTAAQDASPTLTQERWQELVGGSNPHDIQKGGNIDVQGLVDEFFSRVSSHEAATQGVSEQASAGFGEVSGGQADAVPSMFDEGQGPIDGYTTLSDVEPTQVGQNETGAVAGSEASTAEVKLEDIKDLKDYHTPEVPPEKMFEMTDSAKEYVSEFLGPTSTKEEIFYKLLSLYDGGEIKLPEDLTIDGVDYKENLMGLVEKRLPELAPMKYVDVDPTLTIEEWARLGVPNGDPANIALQPGDKLMTGRLMQFILSGDKSVLFPKP